MGHGMTVFQSVLLNKKLPHASCALAVSWKRPGAKGLRMTD